MTIIINPRGSEIAENRIVSTFMDTRVNIEDLINIMQYYASHFDDINFQIEGGQKWL